MCGIAGFSLSMTDHLQVSPRTLTKRLALSIESRGRDATGFAFDAPEGADGSVLYLKQPLKASDFIDARHHMAIPRSATTMLIHTRAATQGKTDNPHNNHPIVVNRRGPYPSVVGVHNGVLRNDFTLWRDTWPDLAEEKQGEVDSQLLFQVISRKGVDALAEIKGDASIAWLKPDNAKALNVARMGGRPLAYVITPGGSFIFASTEECLVEALSYFPQLGTFAKTDCVEMKPGAHLVVVRGHIIGERDDFPVITMSHSYSGTSYSGTGYSHYTAGGAPKGQKPLASAPNKPATVTNLPTVPKGKHDTPDDPPPHVDGTYRRWNSEKGGWDYVAQTLAGSTEPNSKEDKKDDEGRPFVTPNRGLSSWQPPQAGPDSSWQGGSTRTSTAPPLPTGAVTRTSAEPQDWELELFSLITAGLFDEADLDIEIVSAFIDITYAKGDPEILEVLMDDAMRQCGLHVPDRTDDPAPSGPVQPHQLMLPAGPTGR